MEQLSRSDFADEWFDEDEEGVLERTILHPSHNVQVKWIRILKEDNRLHRQKGEYISLSFQSMKDAVERKEIAHQLVEILDHLCNDISLDRILVVGLGNEEMISDAIGPKTIQQILVSAHYFELQESIHPGMRNCAAIAPKVMGQTGLESSRIVKGVVDFYQPHCVLVVDALATDSFERINHAIQISTVGIVPGSGVGNHRLALDQHTLGVPVISIGVATVSTIRSIVKEVDEHAESKHNDWFVTPRSMDVDCRQIVAILSEGMNCFIHPAYEEL